MINTAIVQKCSARSDFIEVGGMVFRKLNNGLIYLFFFPVTQIFQTHQKDVCTNVRENHIQEQREGNAFLDGNNVVR